MKDVAGVMDPTNPFNPFLTFGDIQPLRQARIAQWNPVTEDWFTRFRGFIESFEYVFDPSQQLNVVTVTLIDIFAIIEACEMFPGVFGDPAPTPDEVFFEDTADGDLHGMKIRIEDILTNAPLGNCGIPAAFYDVFSGNVSLHEGHYSPGESAMSAIQEAVDAEFPGVGNVYVDRLGLLAVHGRYARFDPVGTSAATGWDFNDWRTGDGAAVALSPSDTAHIRAFSFSRDLEKIINVASASPVSVDPVADFTTQVVVDATSKGIYGIRPWSTQNLLTKEGVTDGLTGPGADWFETKRFAQYYVDNYADPKNRVTTMTFRPMDIGRQGAAANWDFLTRCDINDRVTITIGSPGGGGFTAEPFFIEGVHETIRPMQGDAMDDVTLTLDVSPAAYFEDSPFAT
jgi:hypothetical protein